MASYLVTVSPKVVTYAGTHTYGVQSCIVVAKDRAAAIKQVRQERRNEEGRFGVPATFSARQATPEECERFAIDWDLV